MDWTHSAKPQTSATVNRDIFFGFMFSMFYSDAT